METGMFSGTLLGIFLLHFQNILTECSQSQRLHKVIQNATRAKLVCVSQTSCIDCVSLGCLFSVTFEEDTQCTSEIYPEAAIEVNRVDDCQYFQPSDESKEFSLHKVADKEKIKIPMQIKTSVSTEAGQKNVLERRDLFILQGSHQEKFSCPDEVFTETLQEKLERSSCRTYILNSLAHKNEYSEEWALFNEVNPMRHNITHCRFLQWKRRYCLSDQSVSQI